MDGSYRRKRMVKARFARAKAAAAILVVPRGHGMTHCGQGDGDARATAPGAARRSASRTNGAAASTATHST